MGRRIASDPTQALQPARQPRQSRITGGGAYTGQGDDHQGNADPQRRRQQAGGEQQSRPQVVRRRRWVHGPWAAEGMPLSYRARTRAHVV